MSTRQSVFIIWFILWPLAGAVADEKLDRGLVALRCSDGSVYIGWRLLISDGNDVGFHVYRQTADGRPAQKLTSSPIRESTNLVDTSAPQTSGVAYSVQAVVGDKESMTSASVNVADTPPGASYIGLKLRGDYQAQKAALGDLDGDGCYDCIIKQPNFNTDPCMQPGYWKKSQDTYKIEAYRSDGKFLWRYDMGWSIEEGIWYSPYIVYDLDGDGRAEVYAKAGEGDPRDSDGRVTSGPEWLIQLDGQTGRITRKLPGPDRTGYTDYNYFCRNLLCVAYLDGKKPHLVVVRGTYGQIKVEAYDPQLNLVWRWNSHDERQRYDGSGKHGVQAADVDGDGRDEIILGSAVIDDNGHGLWTNPMHHKLMAHPDVCYVGDIDPQHDGLEIFYGFETPQPRDGVCLMDARTGKVLWSYDGRTNHVHAQGMVGDIIARYPGQECYAGEKDGSQYWLYTAAGERIGKEAIGGLSPRPVYWDADPQKELILAESISDYQGKSHLHIDGQVIAIADCIGDWREEVITSLPGELRIYTTTIPAENRRTCLMQDRLYRLDVATVSMGYFYPPQHSTNR